MLAPSAARRAPRIAVCLVALSTAVGGFAQDASPASTEDGSARFQRVDGIAASVDGDVITWHDVRKEMGDEVFSALGYATRAAREAKIDQQAHFTLRALIRDKILLLRALATKDIRVSTEEVDREMSRTQQKVGSMWEFVELASRKGMTLSEVRRSVKESLLRTKFIQAQFYQTPWGRQLRRFSLTVSPREIRDYYRRNHAEFTVQETVWLRRVIFSASSHGGLDQARALAEQVRAALEKGEKPADVDRRFKLGAADLIKPVDALDPILTTSGLKPALKEWAFSAAEKSVSPVIELAPGLLCVAVIAKKQEADIRAFAGVQDEIVERIRRGKRGIAENKMMLRLFAETDIKPVAMKRWILNRGAQPKLDRAVLLGVFAK